MKHGSVAWLLQSHMTHSRTSHPWNISWMAEASVSRFSNIRFDSDYQNLAVSCNKQTISTLFCATTASQIMNKPAKIKPSEEKETFKVSAICLCCFSLTFVFDSCHCTDAVQMHTISAIQYRLVLSLRSPKVIDTLYIANETVFHSYCVLSVLFRFWCSRLN